MPEPNLEGHSVELLPGTESLAAVEQFSIEIGHAPTSSSVIEKNSVEVGFGAAFLNAVRDYYCPIQCWETQREEANMSGSASGVD